MSTRWPSQVLGVEIVYIRDHVARKVTSIVPGGRGVWALLPDGKVGTNDAEFFRWALTKEREVGVAEKLWRLGKIKKATHVKLEKAQEQKRTKAHTRSVAADLKAYARQIGLALTKEQDKFLSRLADRT